MRTTFLLSVTIILLILSPSMNLSADPDCTDADGWQASISFGYLKNKGITNNSKLDFTKTKVIRLASEKIGKKSKFPEYGEIYRQVHHITFTEKSGKTIEVITVNDVSKVECTMNGTDIFVISHHGRD